MTDAPGDTPSPDGIPDAEVAERRGFSLVWLIPMIAAVIGAWLAYTTIMEQGPEITISFETAEGMEAGKTKIKYRDVEIGVVESIRISEDGSFVVLTAIMEQHAESYLTEGTRFWVIKPRLDISGISGLGTLVSGAYIEIEPGEGEAKRNFEGLEKPPVIRIDTPGGSYILITDTLGSLSARSPIYYRGIRVGQLLGHELAKNKKSLRVHAFVKAPFHELVRENTRFWNVSGIEVKVSADGMTIKTQSLQALLAGGVAFASLTPDSASPQAKNGTSFQLFDSKSDVSESQITEKVSYLVHFDASVRGLSVGAPVEFRGIKIGSVRDIALNVNLQTLHVRVAVFIDIEPQRVLRNAQLNAKRPSHYVAMNGLVKKGLRAQLQTGSLLTGQKLISLDFHPERPTKELIQGGQYPEIPSIPSTVQQITESATRLLAKLEKLPIDVLIADLRGVIRSMDGTVKEARIFVSGIKGATGELLRVIIQVAVAAKSMIGRAEKALASVDSLTGDNSEVRQQLATMLQELTDASRSIRQLADFLERHPEALIKGKSGSAQ
ncbi:MAG: MlaD family protein [Alphaproteobacteria bacterium]|nr:MlaD family protein [Alphaproteobacteria bacterium]